MLRDRESVAGFDPILASKLSAVIVVTASSKERLRVHRRLGKSRTDSTLFAISKRR